VEIVELQCLLLEHNKKPIEKEDWTVVEAGHMLSSLAERFCITTPTHEFCEPRYDRMADYSPTRHHIRFYWESWAWVVNHEFTHALMHERCHKGGHDKDFYQTLAIVNVDR
jgi:hypothetical protein